MDQNQPQYHGPERRRSQGQPHTPERRKLDWPFKPMTAAEREHGIAPTTTPGRADVKP
jgi:hypothetical protein